MKYYFRYRKERSKIEKEIYRPVAGIHLKGNDGNWYLFYTYIDSGADISLFTRTDCELMGYELESGEEHHVGGIAGLIRIFIHEIPMRIGDEVFNARVGFADKEEVPRLLGRIGVFSKFQICFDENNLSVYFAANN